jgi:hypothetical protein
MKRLALLIMLGLGIAGGLAATFATMSPAIAGKQDGPKPP